MDKKGFTLAEVLITLGIIGVIAALTLPSLNTEHKKQVWSNSLSVGFSNLETALTATILREDVSKFTKTDVWKAFGKDALTASSADADITNFVNEMKKSMPFVAFHKGLSSVYTEEIKTLNNNGSPSATVTYNPTDITYVGFETRKGMIYWLYRKDVTATNEATEGEEEPAAEDVLYTKDIDGNFVAEDAFAQLMIDVNGAKKPNIIGRDIHFFIISQDGRLQPYGSAYISNSTTNKTWEEDAADFACTNTTKKAGGKGCTARLIEKGYRMDY